jgi:hypothetical protein
MYTLTASATDDSGDPILYTFTLAGGARPPIVLGPGTAGSVQMLVPAGTWTATVEADDSILCEDKAADATCSRVIEAPGDPENLAWQGTATQSSTGWDATADRGNDGVTDGAFWNGSVTHTLDADASPWWQVDLGEAHELDRIVLWNRTDSCGTIPCGARLTNFRVMVLDGAAGEVWGEDFFTDSVSYPDPALGGFEIPLPAGTEGRIVHVQILGPNQVDAPVGTIAILSLAEVEVFRGGSTQEPEFHRGDPNGDGSMNITDGIFVLNFLFLGGSKPGCMESADANDDGAVNITDGIYMLNYLFLGGPAPRAPGAPAQPCGPDPAGSPDLGCDAYEKC